MAPTYVLIVVLMVTGFVCNIVADKPACTSDQYEFQYTECDDLGHRWRVAVPKDDSCDATANAYNFPHKAKDCDFECGTGQYLDVNSQMCENCPAGTYSSGDSVRYDDWTSLPAAFSIHTRHFSLHSDDDKPINCSQYVWTPKGKYIAAIPKQCQSELVLSVTLVKPGKMTFEYQYPGGNSIFNAKVQSDQCQSILSDSSTKWPEATYDGTWKQTNMELKKGLNVITWHVIGIDPDDTASPILIRKIHINGVAFTSDCTKCEAGTYSSVGSTLCTDCPPNTWSDKRATICTPCDPKTEYSTSGSTECTTKPACKETDYYYFLQPCDENQKTATSYQWIEPMICNSELPDSVPLPPSSDPIDCLACNPGMHLVDKACTYCPENHKSDGKECTKCDSNTAPEYAYAYQNWNAIPAELEATCIPFSDYDCSNDTKWLPFGNYIEAHFARGENAYLVLQVHADGFRTHSNVAEGGTSTVAQFKMEFELQCETFCQLVLLSDESGKQDVVNTWAEEPGKIQYTYDIKSNGSYTFTLAFHNTGWLRGPGEEIGKSRAKIYSIEVTNTLGGGAKTCRKCPKGLNEDGCIPCPDGNYIDQNTTSCVSCPPHTIIDSHTPYGAEACKACGRGLTVYKGRMCINEGTYKDDIGHIFDMKNISNKYNFVQGSLLFTSSGTQYYHGYNISLFGTPDKSYVICENNVTVDADSGSKEPRQIKAKICRTTIVPSTGDVNAVMTTQSTSLGDELIEIVRNQSELPIQSLKWSTHSDMYTDSGFDVTDVDNDIQVYFKSDTRTRACSSGRHTLISLRCDEDQKGAGEIKLPPKCPDGTCDGCTFHFMWLTSLACPVCVREDFQRVEGVCNNGYQTIHYIAPRHCTVPPELTDINEEKKCSMQLTALPIMFQIAVPAILGLVGICFFVACILWRKNKKLEYRYMKLVEGSGGGDAELPAADSCGLEEDEDEGGDSVTIKSSKGARFFKKLTNKIKKDDFWDEKLT